MRLGVLSMSERLYSTRRLLEASRARGHEVHLLDHTRCSAQVGSRGPVIWHAGRRVLGPEGTSRVPADDAIRLDAVIPRIGTSVTDHGVAIVRQFETMGVLTAVRALSIRRARDKLRALQLLSRKGVPVPHTAFARRPRPVDPLVRAVDGPPVVIKAAAGTQGVGVVLAETLEAARAAAEAFNQVDKSFIVQEFVSEARGADFRAFVVDGQVVASMERTAAGGDFRSNLHRGGRSRPTELSPKEHELAVRAARHLGLSICGVDLLRSRRGPLLLEVNASPGLEGIETTTGVDVADAIISFIEGRLERVRARQARLREA